MTEDIQTAVVLNADADKVARYLPSNYRVMCKTDQGVIIEGTDNRGWTMLDYVIPRLASGGMRCTTVVVEPIYLDGSY